MTKYGDLDSPEPQRKAYKVFEVDSPYSTVVFGENIREARKIARGTEACEHVEYRNIRVKRYPQMDEHYRGLEEIDWYNAQDRIALVSLGWSCNELSDECDRCPAMDYCREWEGL